MKYIKKDKRKAWGVKSCETGRIIDVYFSKDDALDDNLIAPYKYPCDDLVRIEVKEL